MADESIAQTKACTKCGAEKPATLGYFRPWSATDGRLRGKCRLCEGFKSEGIVSRPRQKLTESERRERNLRLRRDSYARNRDAQLARVRADRKANPEKYREWDRRNYEKNKVGTDYNRRRYQRLDKEAAKQALKRWKAENPDKVRAMWERTYAKHKPKHTARMLRWIKNNPQKVAIIRNRRRAREIGASGDYSIEDVRALLKQFGRICFYCGCALKKFHVDHFIPLVRGGANGPPNLRLSCPSCNWSKGGKMPWEWMPDKFRQEETG